MKRRRKQVRRRPTPRQTLGAKVEEAEASEATDEPAGVGSRPARTSRRTWKPKRSASEGEQPPGAVKLPGAKGARGEDEPPAPSVPAKPKEKPPATRRKPEATRKPAGAAARRGRDRGSRPQRGAGAKQAGAGLMSALRQGASETRKRSHGMPTRVGRAVNSGLVAFYGIFFDVVAFLFHVGLVAVGLVAGPGRALVGRAVAFVALISRLLTPARALALVVAGGAVLLALSQFADYRGVSIGTDAYSEVNQVAPPPEIDRKEAGDPHSYLMIPVALACLALLVMAMRGRWRLCRLIALGGVAAIVVGLVVDRPAGLDPGDAAQAYQGVEASLLGGFYAQLFAGLLLAASALLLGRELKLAAKSSPAKAPEARRAARKLLRRRPRAEGARA